MASSTLSSVTKALRVLKAFTNHNPEWGVTDLSRHLDLGKSTVHRLLSTLVASRMLEQDLTTGRYRLGLAMFDLAAAVPTQIDLHEAVMVPVADLRHRCGETVHVGVLDGRQVVYIERLDSPNTVRMFLEVGRRNHAHCTATGKAMLAYLSISDLDRLLKGWDLPRVTDHTITDPDKLRQELATVRDRGYAENRYEADATGISLAAPVRGIGGRVVAAIGLAGPGPRIEENHLAFSQGVVEAAAHASRRLGFRR